MGFHKRIAQGRISHLLYINIERLKKFKTFFPEYADRKVVGAVAGIVIDEKADTFAYRQGFFVIVQSGEIVTILNDEKFQPKLY